MKSLSILLLLLWPIAPSAWQASTSHSAIDTPQTTLLVNCPEHAKETHIRGPVSLSEDQIWRAYVEVDVRSDVGCLYTTRLWVAKGNEQPRLIYLIPPKREAVANGMEILGWARKSRMVLVRTEQWQIGSDAADTQQVIAFDAGTGIVYSPDLEHLLGHSKDKQCAFRVTDAGFDASGNVDILVRTKFHTFIEVGDTEEDIPLEHRCQRTQETWSFNFANGEIKQIGNSETLQLFRKFLLNRANPSKIGSP